MLSLPVLEAHGRSPLAAGPRRLASVRMLRISVTDRCNLRCAYCMPADGIAWLADGLLAADEIAGVAGALMDRGGAGGTGVTHLKVTGGEPTVRRDLPAIIEALAALRPADLSLTTNGLQLPRMARLLRAAGVDRVTLSCDSLRADRYAEMTGGGSRAVFERGLEAAREAWDDRLKLNVVLVRGWNDDELEAFAALTIDRPWTVRFIEYMPLGASRLTATPGDALVPGAEVRARIARALSPTGVLEPVARSSEPGAGPAAVWRIPGAAGRIGLISAMSEPFCETCNRLRLTSIGELRACLFDGGEVDLRPWPRPRIDRKGIAAAARRCVAWKPAVHAPLGERAMSQVGG